MYANSGIDSPTPLITFERYVTGLTSTDVVFFPTCAVLPCIPPRPPARSPLPAIHCRMNATFSLYSLSAKIRDFRVQVFPFVIGRSRDADIMLDDRWVSRRHCVIEEQDGRLVVRDLGSKHGTFVNDGLIRESVLLPGDKLNLGLTTLVAVYDLPDRPLAVDSHTGPCNATAG